VAQAVPTDHISIRRPTPRTLAWAALVLAVALPLAALPLPWAAGLVAGVGVALLVLAKPQWGLYLLAFSVPFESLRQFDLGGTSLGTTEALVALLGLAWGLRVATRRPGGAEPRDVSSQVNGRSGPASARSAIAVAGSSAVGAREWAPGVLLGPLLLMLAAVVASTLRAVALGPALKEDVRWLEVIVVYLAASDLLRSPRRRAILITMLLLAGTLEAGLGYVQFLLRLGPPSFRSGGFLRAYGTFGQPNPYAGYLGTLLPLGLALALAGWAEVRARRTWPYALALIVLALLGGALAASMSRGGLLGFAFAVAVVASVTSRRALAVAVACFLAGLVALILGAFALLPPQISERITQVSAYFGWFDVRTVAANAANWAIVERMAHWQSAWAMFQAYPFLGVGPGNYPNAYPAFAMPGWKEDLGHAHNIYLNLLAENGAVGLTAYLVFWLVAFLLVWRRCRPLGPGLPWWERAVPLGVLGVLSQVSLHNLFDNLMVHGLNVQLALLLALAAWSADGGRKVVPRC